MHTIGELSDAGLLVNRKLHGLQDVLPFFAIDGRVGSSFVENHLHGLREKVDLPSALP